MARRQKQGLDYFPLDVDFFQDKETRILKAKYGVDGVSIYLYLLCEVYRNGYYLKVDDDFIYIMADDLRMSSNKIKQVLNFLLERSLFEDKLFQSDKILTSASIQEQFQLAVKERAKKTPIEIKDFWLLEKSQTESFIKVKSFLNNSEKNNDNSEKKENNSREESTKESKVNKSKINKNKENKSTFINPVKLFEEFWAVYPKKSAKALAERAYIDILIDTDWLKEAQLLEAVRNYADYCKILDIDQKYIKMASNWLKDLTWIDYLPENYERPKRKETATKNNFNNVNNRQYDYSQLERQLLKK